MCQSKENGGKRCEKTITSADRSRLRNLLKETDPSDPQYAVYEKSLSDLNEAKKLYGPCVSHVEIPMPDGVRDLLEEINSKGYSPLLVGGTVRDALVGGTAPKDFDIEVYGVDVDTLASSLRASGYNVDEVGKAFGVLKVVTKGKTRDDIDISVPRKDSLAGAGHRGFDVAMDSSMTVEEASARRDFTFNALTWDYRYNTVIDPHNGREDLEAGVMRHVSPAFAEDPLRVLRGFQFAGRFGVEIDPQTAEFCRTLAPRSKELAQERIATEWEKFYLKAKEPSKAMNVLRQAGWNSHAPGLNRVNTEESNVDAHLDSAYTVSVSEKLSNDKKIGLYSAILMRKMDDKEAWDFTKTTIIGDKLQKAPLMMRSMKPAMDSDDYSLRRLAQEAGQKNVSLKDWARYESIAGNKELSDVVSARASKLGILHEPEKPFLMGRHVLTLTDKKPGKWMKDLLADAEERQYRGEFKTEADAISWAKARV